MSASIYLFSSTELDYNKETRTRTISETLQWEGQGYELGDYFQPFFGGQNSIPVELDELKEFISTYTPSNSYNDERVSVLGQTIENLTELEETTDFKLELSY